MPNTGRHSGETEKIEISQAMADAGANVILAEFGGVDLRGSFSHHDLAASVFRAMEAVWRREHED